MTYDKHNLQPGSYHGEPDIFVLRDLMQLTKTRAEAEAYTQNADRTWAIFIGVGDFETQTFDLIGYKQDSAVVYTDETIGQVTEQPYIESVCYVDKHPQPTHDGVNGTLPTALQDMWGDLTTENARVVAQYHETGDVHIATYDYGKSEMLVALGRIDEKGNYGNDNEWKAYNRPYLRFNLNDLWAGL